MGAAVRQNGSVIDMIMWDLDETLLPSETLRAVRHGADPCDLALVPAYTGIALHAGIADAIRRSSVVQCGLVSSSPRWYVDQILREHLPEASFDVLVTYDDVVNLKPDPEPIQRALAQLSIPPDRALYIGDDLVDHQACLAAGVRFLGAGWADTPTFPAETETLEHPLDLLELLDEA